MAKTEQFVKIRAELTRPKNARGTPLRADCLSRWDPSVHAAGNDENSISIYDYIGDDGFEDGVTTRRVAAALRRIGSGTDVTVNINSPGGDYFEGLAIYNTLRQHDGNVTVNVLGLAASAASMIAMAGDDIRIAEDAFLMVHNSQSIVVGDRNDIRRVADHMDSFDSSMRNIYARRSKQTVDQMAEWMDAETFFSGPEAIELGLADALVSADQVAAFEGQLKAEREDMKAKAFIESSLMQTNPEMSRKERRALLASLAPGTPGAADPVVTPRADFSQLTAGIAKLTDLLKH